MDPLELPLRDIHLPEAPGLWPLAPGWWLLAVLLVAMISAAAVLLRRRRRDRRRLVRQELQRLRRGYRDDGDAAALLRKTSELLRRALIERCGRTEVAALAGPDWLRLLDGDDPSRPFSEGPGRILADGPYRPPDRVDPFDPDALLQLCERRLLQGQWA